MIVPAMTTSAATETAKTAIVIKETLSKVFSCEACECRRLPLFPEKRNRL